MAAQIKYGFAGKNDIKLRLKFFFDVLYVFMQHDLDEVKLNDLYETISQENFESSINEFKQIEKNPSAARKIKTKTQDELKHIVSFWYLICQERADWNTPWEHKFSLAFPYSLTSSIKPNDLKGEYYGFLFQVFLHSTVNELEYKPSNFMYSVLITQLFTFAMTSKFSENFFNMIEQPISSVNSQLWYSKVKDNPDQPQIGFSLFD
jgi:hypothetical protein